ncbi:uncharacterized protein [Phaseolus vulgaris]|uniref:uncharacterized protein n=1 Tax=Phaseolus vulgaris TaxID=3885 RepID=UPI0035CC8825
MTDLPLLKVLSKPDIAKRMVKWVVKLSKFDIQYESRGPLKGQVLVDFIVDLTPKQTSINEDFKWSFLVYGASNPKGSEAGIILEGPNGVHLKQALCFCFKASNYQVEYETLIIGMLLAKEMGVSRLMVKSDLQLIVGQITGGFQAKDPHLSLYLNYVKTLAESFSTFNLIHVPIDQNS